MSKIDRWQLVGDDACVYMHESGDYVDYEDHAARIRTLEAELAQAKADRDVLAKEVRAWRNAEHLRINEPHNEFRTRADARAATDASGALERAGGK